MEIATLQDLEQAKQEIISETKKLINGNLPKPEKWVKAKRAREILNCSVRTLQNSILLCKNTAKPINH